jgi:tetrahydromethanopterin S-methyltransferase subunit G
MSNYIVKNLEYTQSEVDRAFKQGQANGLTAGIMIGVAVGVATLLVILVSASFYGG